MLRTSMPRMESSGDTLLREQHGGVASTKDSYALTALRKTLGKTTVSLEELEPLLVETEAVLNSRPITFVHADPKEPFPLTPGHFLLGNRPFNLLAIKLSREFPTSSNQTLLKRFNYRETLLNHFWK